MDFRQAIGHKRQWLDTGISRGFSNFLYVDEHYHSNAVLRRIFSLARKHDYHSLLVEEIAEADCTLMAAESAAIAKRRADFQRSEVHRLSFFRCPSSQAPVSADFIGYVVFKRDYFSTQPQPRVHVFESVMPPFRQVEQNNFIHCKRPYEVNTSFGRFSVTGVLYAQQNDLTAVCAHVALRTALACVLPDGDITYERMNLLAGIDQARPLGGGSGLGPGDMEKILVGLNLQYDKVLHEPNLQLLLPTEYQRDLYGCIESGLPALLGFELGDSAAGANNRARHVIPVFGHRAFHQPTSWTCRACPAIPPSAPYPTGLSSPA